MGRLSRLEQVDLVGVSVTRAPSLRVAMQAVVRPEPLYAQNHRGQLSLMGSAGGVWLRFCLINPYNIHSRFVVDPALTGWISRLGVLARRLLKAEWVEIKYPVSP